MMLPRIGGPEVLRAVDLPLPDPGPKQLRVRIRAAGVGSTDLMMLAGRYTYAPPMPFVPGYEIAGVVDAIGTELKNFRIGQRVAALTLHGGFAEYIVRDAEHFIPIPDGVSDVQAAAAVLNYVTAWQMVHRVAKVQRGQTALVTGAAGGVGTATLQLLRLAGVKTHGAASTAKHAVIRQFGATPIDYRQGRLDRLVRACEPHGVDVVFDAVGGTNITPCIKALRRGGTLVGFGFMGVNSKLSALTGIANVLLGARLRGRRGAFYGITMLYRKDRKPLREDLPKILALIEDGSIDPLIDTTFLLLSASAALERLASGATAGKIVLTVS
jgi:NADPH:quinone reductase